MPNRRQHQQQVQAFLNEHLSPHEWEFSLPHGRGKESYFAQGNGQHYFVKVGVQAERYLAMAEIGLTPPVVLHGQLEDGLPVIVQSFAPGRTPSRLDCRERLTEVAEIIRIMHNSPRIKAVLEAAPSNLYQDAGMSALDRLREKWERHKAQVPSAAGYVDESLEKLAQQVDQFSGEGLAASHGDICNANWLFTSDRKIYLIDFDLMSMDDPALDLGALLWWYYPPGLRQSFLDVAGYCYDEAFELRMRVRMSMHCLDILLPREESFDRFEPDGFGGSLRDFKAAQEGRENPEGYE
jgi:thiamine kinase-like enzyme